MEREIDGQAEIYFYYRLFSFSTVKIQRRRERNSPLLLVLVILFLVVETYRRTERFIIFSWFYFLVMERHTNGETQRDNKFSSVILSFSVVATYVFKLPFCAGE